MMHCTHLWDRMFPKIRRYILKISVKAVGVGLHDAKAPVTKHATELKGTEHHENHYKLRRQADGLTISAFKVEGMIQTLKNTCRRSRLASER